MAENRSVAVVSLNSVNYATWKVQCRMVLVKEGLWNIVNGTEKEPAGRDTGQVAKFKTRKDKALATIVLAIEPNCSIYLEIHRIQWWSGRS